jgi:hypothetical protein
MVTHSTPRDLGRKATSLSFVAFERSIKAELGSPGKQKSAIGADADADWTYQTIAN